MNILILGSGGREHTFAYKIAQSVLTATRTQNEDIHRNSLKFDG